MFCCKFIKFLQIHIQGNGKIPITKYMDSRKFTHKPRSNHNNYYMRNKSFHTQVQNYSMKVFFVIKGTWTLLVRLLLYSQYCKIWKLPKKKEWTKTVSINDFWFFLKCIDTFLNEHTSENYTKLFIWTSPQCGQKTYLA